MFALHNVREDVVDKDAWNIGFMVVAGIGLPLLGCWMARRGLEKRTDRTGRVVCPADLNFSDFLLKLPTPGPQFARAYPADSQ